MEGKEGLGRLLAVPTAVPGCCCVFLCVWRLRIKTAHNLILRVRKCTPSHFVGVRVQEYYKTFRSTEYIGLLLLSACCFAVSMCGSTSAGIVRHGSRTGAHLKGFILIASLVPASLAPRCLSLSGSLACYSFSLSFAPVMVLRTLYSSSILWTFRVCRIALRRAGNRLPLNASSPASRPPPCLVLSCGTKVGVQQPYAAVCCCVPAG